MTRSRPGGTPYLAVCALTVAVSLVVNQHASAQINVQGTPLPGALIPKWVDPLPGLHLTGATDISLTMEEMQSPVMPTGFVAASTPYVGTWVWRYRDNAVHTSTSHIGPVVLATRGVPTTMRFTNNLGTTASTNLAFWKTSIDQTLHWADPFHTHTMPGPMPMTPYVGPIMAVPHLHGGEVPPQLDGGPDAWFTSDGLIRGPSYYTHPTLPAAGNECVYRYPNEQEASPIWFHDHSLGATRLNVYAGMAGAYLIQDPALTLPQGLTPYGIGNDLIVPVVIQDRMFDTDGQLYFPNVGINPMLHPFWQPEFVGDTIVVNGKVWPTFGTAAAPKPAQRYRFLFLNGSNARAYELYLEDPVTNKKGPPMWVIGTDGGYLDTPVKIDPANQRRAQTKLVIMPGERYDVIIDFNDPVWRAANKKFSGTLILRNTAAMPYPNGVAADPATVGQIMKFFIGAPVAVDPGYNPATLTPLRAPMTRLVDPVAGTPAVGIVPTVRRLLTLNEVMGMAGPAEVLVNNTKWSGKSVADDVHPLGIRPDSTLDPTGAFYVTEMPAEGAIEQWDIINMTVDAHPIHLHLVQFQLMNRQDYQAQRYTAAYDALFPGTAAIDPMTGLPHPPGVFIGGYGPPLNYATGNLAALGGNPDVTPFLRGAPQPPLPSEAGWKDTVVVLPGQVTRILVRWAPTSAPAAAANATFPFDPQGVGPLARGYVWHCHIIDHEDNEMMRPDLVMPAGTLTNPITRTFLQGIDY